MHLHRNQFWSVASILSAFCSIAGAAETAAPAKPNIVIIYSDDVGWGDLSCYGAARVSTPHLDRLAAEGIRFTDAHTTASTCTPSRYSILTGEYSFRNKRAQILTGDAPSLIKPGTPTLPQVLKDHGYVTGCIGKWHLGLGNGKIDWNGTVQPGPLEIGFSSSFILPATPDRVPCVYLQGHQVLGLDPADPVSVSYEHRVGNEPTGDKNPGMLRYPADPQHSGTIVDHISRIGWMAGGHSAWWKDEEMTRSLTHQAEDFITQNAHQPFFLYFALNDVHVPRAPDPEFLGKSQCGLRGDQIEELDWSAGQILAKLDALHLTDNTLVIFSSDNGPILMDGYIDGSMRDANGHKPAGPYRGGKYQIFEGGTRVPFITYWPGHLKEGVSDALISQVDLLTSLANLTGAPMPADAGPDSMNLLHALLDAKATGRDHMLEQSGIDLAIRQGSWKFIPPGIHKAAHLEEGDSAKVPLPSPAGHLFDLSIDPGEKHDVAADHPDVVASLTQMLQKDTSQQRTRPE